MFYLAIRRNLITLATALGVIALIATAYCWRQSPMQAGETALAGQSVTSSDMLFVGLRHASPSEIHAALPQSAGKPTLLFFSSYLCHDCRRLSPVVERLTPKYPTIFFRKIDVLKDKNQSPAVLRTFRPVSVPVLVFIDPHGEIVNVLYSYQSANTVSSALTRLVSDAGTENGPETNSQTKK